MLVFIFIFDSVAFRGGVVAKVLPVQKDFGRGKFVIFENPAFLRRLTGYRPVGRYRGHSALVEFKAFSVFYI